MTNTEIVSVMKGARDMLRESAKQHRGAGDGAGHGKMADLHADQMDKAIEAAEVCLHVTTCKCRRCGEPTALGDLMYHDAWECICRPCYMKCRERNPLNYPLTEGTCGFSSRDSDKAFD